MVLEDREFKTGYEHLGYFNMSSKYLVLNLKERATPVEWLLFEIVSRQGKMIVRLGDTIIELAECVAHKIAELETK